MKRKLILIALLGILPVFSLFAQPEKGKVLLGLTSRYSLLPLEEGLNYPDIMTLGFSTVKFKTDASGEEESESSKFSCFNLTPIIGYFVIDNLALGLDINVGMSSMKETYDIYDYKSTGSFLTAGPFIRYCVPVEKLLPYIEAGATLGSAKNTYESGNETEEYKSGISSFMGGAGIAALLGDKVTLDLLVGYLSMTIKEKEDNPNNERMVIGTLGFKFGVVVFL